MGIYSQEVEGDEFDYDCQQEPSSTMVAEVAFVRARSHSAAEFFRIALPPPRLPSPWQPQPQLSRDSVGEKKLCKGDGWEAESGTRDLGSG